MAGRDLVPLTPPLPATLAERFRAASGAGRAGGAGGRDEDAAAVTLRVLELLETLDPERAALARGCLPRCDSTFGAGLALFLAVTAAGCRDWIGGDAAADLEALDGGLLLDECDRALTPRFQPVEGRVWRVSRVPLLGSPAGLLCATSVDDGLADSFTVVLQARPARLGAVQLMATVAGRKLDVTLRAATGLPAALLAELHESFRATLADCGLDGALTVGPLAGAWLGLDDDALSSDLAL
ncbi:hypothetical protein [Azospirillum agricola]|uniref:hypothetical protein n=1 Tax=Azospirillum agricola TaxID=1720247 RepID=UPI000A0EEF44|nr:hypothetical protein [Azospirillum agricola]MBP2232399.1 hypothetical protein [Azospirillum agricola]SMH62964.1 hypothetical protein SAMN02982994_6790 [Azospirillum lipoferum]